MTIAGNVESAYTTIKAIAANGDVSITATGDITRHSLNGIPAAGYGIEASGKNITIDGRRIDSIKTDNSDGDVNIRADSVTQVRISHINSGSNYLYVGTRADLINIYNNPNALGTGTTLVKTGAGSAVVAKGTPGIRIQEFYTLSSSIILNGDLKAYAGAEGIVIDSRSRDVSVDLAATSYFYTQDADGIVIDNLSIASSGGVSVTADGEMIIDGTAIAITTKGGAQVSMAGTGDITAGDDGIVVVTGRYGDAGASITMAAGSSVTAGGTALSLTNKTSGALTITSGAVTGDVAIFAYNGDKFVLTGTDLTITTGAAVTSTAGAGISAFNYGAGAITITTNDTVTATGIGVRALGGGNGTNISITANDTITSSGGRGIVASNSAAAGGITITVNDAISSVGGGVYAMNGGTGGVTVTTGVGSSITDAANAGIVAGQSGNGALGVTVNGSVTGVGGITASKSSGTGAFTITTGAGSAVDGTTGAGINAQRSGAGTLSITANGTVSGQTRGIYARTTFGATGLSVTSAAQVTATGGTGVYARNSATGASSVSVDDVTATGIGLQVINDASAGGLTITAASTSQIVSTASGGIYATKAGTGNISITAHDVTVVGGAITAIATGAGNTTINITGDLSGSNGIYTQSLPGSTVNVTTAAGKTVTATSGYGIRAYNGFIGAGGAINLQVDSNITSSATGILATSFSGSVSAAVNGTVNAGVRGVRLVSFNGLVTASLTTGASSAITATGGDGVYMDGYTAAATLDGDVTGSTKGVNIKANSGATITTGAGSDIVGQAGEGLKVLHNSGNTKTVTLALSGDVTGSTVGVSTVVTNAFKNNVNATVNAGSVITGQGGAGMYISSTNANAGNTGTNTITVAGDVIGSTRGMTLLGAQTNINATVNSGATVTGTANEGLYAAASGAVAMTVSNAGTVTGATTGIFAKNTGTGATSVSVDGTVTGGGTGLYAYGKGTSLYIHTGASSAIFGTADYGIHAVNKGSGGLTMVLNGYIDPGATGVYAVNNSGGASDLILDANADIIGQQGVIAKNLAGRHLTFTSHAGKTITGTVDNGVSLYQYGTGALTASIAGTITGAGIGLDIYNYGGSAGSLTIDTTATITGTGGTAINIHAGVATPITINGGAIVGDVIDNNPSAGFTPTTVAGTFTSQGNFDVSDFNVSAPGVFTFGAGKTITSFSTVNVAGAMNVAANGSSITGDLSVDTGGYFNVGGDFTVTGDFVNNGTTEITTGKTLTVDTMSAGTGNLTFGVTSQANHAQLTAVNSAVDLSNQYLFINVAGVNSITQNDEILLAHGNSALIGGPGGTPTSVADNSFLWDFLIVDGTGLSAPGSANDLYLILVQNATNPDCTGAYTQNNTNACNTLLPLDGVTTDPELLDVMAQFNGAPTQDAFNNVLEAVQPTVDGGQVVATLSFADSILDLTSNRLRTLHEDGYGMQGMAAGDSWGKPGRGWFQVTGQYIDQDRRGTIDGYEARSFGTTLGADTDRIFENGIAGIAFTYGKTFANAQNANSTDTDINTYQLTLYADNDLGDGYYLNTLAGAALNRNKTSRHNVGMVPGLTAHGDYDSHLLLARIEGGKAFRMGEMTLTPNVTLNGTHFTQEDYTETGAGGAGLHVAMKNLDQLDAGIGGKAAWTFNSIDGTTGVTQVHGGYRRALTDARLQAVSSFVGGGAPFATEGAPFGKDKINLGTEVRYFSSGNYEFTASYDLDLKSDFVSHTAFLRFSYNFQ